MVSTMKLDPIVTACTSLIFAISMTRRFHLSEAQSFSIDLFHRDFLQFPSLVSSSTSWERVTNALRRSFNRVNTLKQDHMLRLVSTDIFPDKGEYLMKFSISTLPVETLAIADTGSDLTWIRCSHPSSLCFHQKPSRFEPTHSSTYKPISCTSGPCNSFLGSSSCDGFKGICRYTIEYGDGSYSNGYLATETIIGSRYVYLVDFACYKHDPSFLASREAVLQRLETIISPESIAFCSKVMEKSGVSDNVFVYGLKDFPPKSAFDCGRGEAETVITGAMDDLLARTGVNPRNIGVVIVNISLFNPLPSLSAMIVNRYKLREDVMSYNLGGMGCSAGVIAVDLAKRILQVRN
ncbi:3-ketoacyl-CoA synthase 20 [Sesamum alatum]|uniref:3-ketoacyl-CoA synthase 20 n=1 Tax=Sesamum alatum TaxID=300844 RepID=A0AAE1XRE0_9LAMI|nr:3-ketoacyl-CoA synthase 20 [Sesamum alatum]